MNVLSEIVKLFASADFGGIKDLMRREIVSILILILESILWLLLKIKANLLHQSFSPASCPQEEMMEN